MWKVGGIKIERAEADKDIDQQVNFSKNGLLLKFSVGKFFRGQYPRNRYTLSSLNIYAKGVSQTSLSALLPSEVLVILISELGSLDYIVKSAILIF